MKRWLVCYANRKFADAQQWLVQSARRFGFDRICEFNDSDLRRTEFFRQHQQTLTAPRGAGYWLWKPYLISQVLEQAAPGDVVAYIDSGMEIIADLTPVIEICKAGRGIVLCHGHGGYNIIWTKRSCLVGMGCDHPRYHWAESVMGGFQFYRRTQESRQFVDTWLDYCCQPQLLTDAPNPPGMQNYPEFRDHRHDQAILSLLMVRWRLPAYRDPSQWGNPWAMPEFRPAGTPDNKAIVPYTNSPYGQLVDHHRRNRAARHRHRYDGVRNVALKFRQFVTRRKAA